MENNLSVKKNSLLLSLLLLAGVTTSNASADARSYFGKATTIAGVIGFVRASTKDADKSPYSVYQTGEVLSLIKQLVAAGQYKAAAYLIAKYCDDAVIGYVGKPAGITVAGSSLAIKGENGDATSLMNNGEEYHLYEKKAVKPYGILGCTWAEFKKVLDAIKGLNEAHSTLDTFGKITGVRIVEPMAK